MQTMHNLTADYLAVLEMAQDPDVPAEAIADTLEAIGGEIEEKADSYAVVMQELKAESDKLKAEIDRLAARRKSLDANADAMKKRLQESMIATGKTKFKTTLFSFAIQKNGGKIPVIVDVDCTDLPDELVTIKESPNLDAIAKYIEENGDTKYGHFGERGESLRIK